MATQAGRRDGAWASLRHSGKRWAKVSFRTTLAGGSPGGLLTAATCTLQPQVPTWRFALTPRAQTGSGRNGGSTGGTRYMRVPMPRIVLS